MTNRRARALTAMLLVWSGCDGSSISEPNDIAGHYRLVDVSGQKVPTVLTKTTHDRQCTRAGDVGSLTTRLNNGTLDVGADGTFEVGVTIVRICAYGAEQTTVQHRRVADGYFRFGDGRRLLLSARGDFEPTLEGFVETGSITLFMDLTGEGLRRSLRFAPER